MEDEDNFIESHAVSVIGIGTVYDTSSIRLAFGSWMLFLSVLGIKQTIVSFLYLDYGNLLT